MLKWLKKKVYSSLSEVLGAVYKELESLQPVDTDTVKWTKGLTGMKAHAVVQNSPVAMNQVQGDNVQTEYMGWFKVSTHDEGIRVYNGSDPDDSIAGLVYIGTASYAFTSQSLPLSDGYVCAYVSWDVETGYSYGYYQGETITQTDSIWYYPIAFISGLKITQIHQYGIPTITGRWL